MELFEVIIIQVKDNIVTSLPQDGCAIANDGCYIPGVDNCFNPE